MATKNDTRIMQLKKKVEEKRKELKGREVKFSPDTNCMITLDSVRYNLNVCTEDDLKYLLCKLSALEVSAEYVEETFGVEMHSMNISGFSLRQWIGDVRSKLDCIKFQREKKELSDAEKKLDALLSENTKTSLAIDEIESILK